MGVITEMLIEAVVCLTAVFPLECILNIELSTEYGSCYKGQGSVWSRGNVAGFVRARVI
jgi:hypothetical protein